MKYTPTKEHYDLLIQEDNDPVNDPPILQAYMDKWDGKAFIDALSLTSSSRILEIGIGTGRLAKKVLQKGCDHLTGIDISTPTIERAKIHLNDWNNVSLINDDFISHSFNQTFNIIYCSLTFFHFEDKKAAVNKIFSLLDMNGRFVLSIPIIEESHINMGTRKVLLYPDNLEQSLNLLTESGLTVSNVFKTDFANIIVADKV